MPERIGFVGLGIMGGPMARNLMRAGRELVLHNRTRRKAEELAAEGEAEVADSPAEVARECRVTVTMLPGPPEVEEVVAGEGGLLESAREGSLIVDMSTSSTHRRSGRSSPGRKACSRASAKARSWWI